MSATSLASVLGQLYISIYLSTIMSTAFYGATCLQTFFYYVHYENDSLRIKILVAIIWALNTIHEALCISGAYKYTMAGLVSQFSFATGTPELVLTSILTALVSIPTQGFFSYRIYVFSGKNIIVLLIWALLSLVQLVSVTVYVGKALYSVNGIVHAVVIEQLNSGAFATLATIPLSVGAGVDVLMAIFMTFLLIRERAATRFASTAHLLQRLAVFAVNTGTWTATFALLAIILLHVFPTKLFYILALIPLCPVYCNTLLANLNARVYLRDGTPYNVCTVPFTSPSSRVSGNIDGNQQPELREAVPRIGVSSSSKGDSVAIAPQLS